MAASKRVAIVGAGPAGCALATFCARSGHAVTLFENQSPAPAVVGESLLPFGNRVLEQLGVPMDGFVEKTGAVFIARGKRVRFHFEEAERPRWTKAHQVARDDFDERLRACAKEAGAEFVWRQVDEAPRGYDWVVDATGRRRVLGRKWTSYSGHASLRNAAVARHFAARVRVEGAEPGDIAIFALEGAWFWVIPLGEALSSVGLVTTPARRGLKWDEAPGECSELGELLAEAPEVGERSGHRDFTEYAARFSGDGWALVGDAALFLDPVFSSGVLFALEGAERLARVIDGTLSAAEYEEQMRAAASLMEPLILGFYSGDFFDLSLLDAGDQEASLRAGVVSLLAGDLFDGAPRMASVVSRRLPEIAERVRR